MLKILKKPKDAQSSAADKKGKITEFTEKPAEPKTTLVCGAVYAFPKTCKKMVGGIFSRRITHRSAWQIR